MGRARQTPWPLIMGEPDSEKLALLASPRRWALLSLGFQPVASLSGEQAKPMQTKTMPYQWFVDRFFTDLQPVRGFGLWQVWSAEQGQNPLLLVVNEIEETVVQCRYESDTERAEDIALLRRLPPGDEAGAGVFAFPKPPLPTLLAAKAKP